MTQQHDGIGSNVRLGVGVVIEPDAVIGDDAVIGHYAVIKSGTVIGKRAHIGDMAVLGKSPSHNNKMAMKPAPALTPLTIGDDVKIGAHAVIYRGVEIGDDVLVGDLASIRERVSIGASSIVGRNVTVEPKTVIGRRVTIQTGSYVTSDMIIEDEVFIGPCLSSSNDKYMGLGNYRHQGPIIRRKARIGNHATLLPSIEIGEEAVVGAGAVVTKHVAARTTVVGNPARLLSTGERDHPDHAKHRESRRD